MEYNFDCCFRLETKKEKGTRKERERKMEKMKEKDGKNWPVAAKMHARALVHVFGQIEPFISLSLHLLPPVQFSTVQN